MDEDLTPIRTRTFRRRLMAVIPLVIAGTVFFSLRVYYEPRPLILVDPPAYEAITAHVSSLPIIMTTACEMVNAALSEDNSPQEDHQSNASYAFEKTHLLSTDHSVSTLQTSIQSCQHHLIEAKDLQNPEAVLVTSLPLTLVHLRGSDTVTAGSRYISTLIDELRSCSITLRDRSVALSHDLNEKKTATALAIASEENHALRTDLEDILTNAQDLYQSTSDRLSDDNTHAALEATITEITSTLSITPHAWEDIDAQNSAFLVLIDRIENEAAAVHHSYNARSTHASPQTQPRTTPQPSPSTSDPMTSTMSQSSSGESTGSVSPRPTDPPPVTSLVPEGD